MINKKSGRKAAKPRVPPSAAKDVPSSGGEGDRAADSRYREKATRFSRSGKVDEAAEEAEEALRNEEADGLREAEEKGRAPAR